MSAFNAPPAIAGAEPPDTQPQGLQALLEQVDAILHSDGFSQDDMRIFAAFIAKIEMEARSAQMPGGPQQQGAQNPQFTPNQVPGQSASESDMDNGGQPMGGQYTL